MATSTADLGTVTGSAATTSGGGGESTSTTTTGGESTGTGTTTTTTEAPKSLKISFGENEEPVDFDLDDAPAGKQDEAFKFENLEPLKETHADLYKSLKGELSKATRFAKAFKTPEEASAHLQRLERIAKATGVEGSTPLDSIEAHVRNTNTLFNGLMSGDKAIIEKVFKDNPAGLATTAQAMVDNWAKADPNSWSAQHAKVAMSTLMEKDSYGQSAIDALNALNELTAGNPEAQKLMQRVAHTINKMDGWSKFKPDQAPILEQEKAKLAQEKESLWNQATDLKVEPVVVNAISRGLTSLTTELKQQLTSEERTEFREFGKQRFFAHAREDKAFVAKLNELREVKDRDGIVALVNANKAKFAREALKDIHRQKLLNREGIKKEASSKTEAGSGSTSASDKGVVQYTGAMYAGAPRVQYDYPRMQAENPNMLENREFYIVGQSNKYRW